MLTVARELANVNVKRCACSGWFRCRTYAKRSRSQPTGRRRRIDDLIDRHVKRLAHFEDVRCTVTYGGPREELAEFGKELDLLIVGSRGDGTDRMAGPWQRIRYLVGDSQELPDCSVLRREAVTAGLLHEAEEEAEPIAMGS